MTNEKESMSLEQFNPTKAELVAIADKYKGLKIKDVYDTEGYQLVDTARKELKKTRVAIEKTGKELRAEAITFQKKVLEKERELVGVVSVVENDLVEKQRVVNEEKERIERLKMLPEKKAQLEEIGLEVTDALLLTMDEPAFRDFLLNQKEKFVAKQIAEQKEAKEKEEKALADERLQILADRQKIKDEQDAIEREKQKAIEIEQAKEDATEKARFEADAKVEKERVAFEESLKQKNLTDFLSKHGYTKTEDFHLARTADKVILYKKLDEITIK